MKIEKISENQIRCTLSREDLIDRELRISELAYGSEKAKALFRDMMQQANYEFGFDAEDIPLMIEAIPISPECLVLVITKVEDPDELDTRFSKFSPDYNNDYEEDEEDEEELYNDKAVSAFDQDDDKDTFLPFSNPLAQSKKEETKKQGDVSKVPVNLIKVYVFQSLEEVIQLSSLIVTFYKGKNSLYKNLVNSTYYLTVSRSEHTSEEFNRVCNMISEYGNFERTTYASPYYYEEHFDTIIKDTAIQVLANF
jgi:adapter protein MecA 1/2